MDEARSIVSIRASPIEDMSASIDGAIQKLGSPSIINNDGQSPISPSLAESDKKNQRKEICSVYSGQKPTVYINPIVQSESDSGNNLAQMMESVDESKIMESGSGTETAQTVSEVLRIERSNLPSHENIDRNSQKSDRRRRARGTIVWEPLLVPSEMDGKIEMVTALKKVGSNFISAPRAVPKKHDIHLVKSPPFRSSSKSFLTPVVPMKTQKSLVSKVSDSTDVSHHVTTASKPRASGSNIKVQMDKAIAEKEASILKEIESAMREAAKLKNKSSLQSSNAVEIKVSNVHSDQSKVESVIKATPGSGIKRKKTKELSENSVCEESEEPFEISVSVEGTLLPESSIQTLTDMKEKLPTLSNNEVNDVNNICSIVKTADSLQCTSSPASVVKEIGTSKILTTMGTVVTTSVASAGGELQGMHKILNVSSKVSPAVTSSGKDIKPLNRIVHAATNLNPNSTTSLQRILVLTTPSGMKNSAGDNITIMPSLVPISPVVSSAGVTATSSAKSSSMKKSVGKENPQDVHLIVTNLPMATGEHNITEESSLGQFTVQANMSNPSKVISQSNKESTLKHPSTSQGSSSRRKQKTKSMNRELENLVIDCNNVQPSSQSRARSRPSPKSSEDKSPRNGKGRLPKDVSSVHSSDTKSFADQKFSAAKSEKSHSSDKKRQKLSHSPKNEKKDTTKQNNIQSLKERLKKMEQLYAELPPAQPRISLTTDDFSKFRNSFRNNLHNLSIVTESIKKFIHMNDANRDSPLKKPSVSQEHRAFGSPSKEKEAAHILCRLCGGFFKNINVVPLFGELSKEKNVLDMFSTILPQSPTIKEQDGLPQHICLSCIDKLSLCFNIINQFLQADKELRKVLHVENDDSIQGEDVDVARKKETLSPLRVQKNIPINNKLEEKEELPTRSSSDKFKENLKTYERHSLSESGKRKRTAVLEKQLEPQKNKEKKPDTLVETERSLETNSTSNHKLKRRRSRSPQSDKKVNNGSSISKTPAGCIDLSRLDPEFNDGFEVEWCLDEETIRSSLVPEEECEEQMDQVTSGADNNVSLKVGSKPGKTVSVPSVKTCVESSSQDSVSNRKKDVLKKEEPGSSETPKLLDEVSKHSETRPPVRETSVVSEPSQVVTSSREKLKSGQKSSQPPETFKCSHCPLTFPSKQEAFLHKVMEHEEELMSVMKSQESKLYSGSTQKTKDLLQHAASKAGVQKSESKGGKGQETSVCDQCGVPFHNEYSLYIHKCVTHENFIDGQPLEKDAKGLEYKIINSKDMSNEALAQKIADEADGKILVKCGTGMLWVSSSKLLTEEQKTSSQGSEGDEVANVSVENHILPLEQAKESTPSVRSRDFSNLKLFKCVLCKLTFPEKTMLSSHLKTHNDYCCSECPSSFSSLKALNRHLPVHVPADHLCDDCGLVLGDSKKLLQHRKEHTRNLPHVCESCGKRFPNEQTLEVHETVHFDKGGSFSCSLCRKSFFFKHSLVRHGSQHASNRLQKCSLCFRVLKSCDQLRKHVALHHLTKNFVCFCKQTFPSPKELVEHRYLKHSYAEIFCARNKVEIVEPFPLHQCSICFRILTSRQNLLKHHHASHKSIWPFYCIQCSRKYISKSHLKKHECHRKYSAFQCKICGKIFQNKKIFWQHKRIHKIQIWKFLCRKCGDIFEINALRIVQKMNKGDRPFCCQKCLHLSNK